MARSSSPRNTSMIPSSIAVTWANLLAAFAMYVMMTYLTNVWKLSTTQTAGIINIWNGITPALAILFSFFVDAFMGDVCMLVLSSIAYIIVFINFVQNGCGLGKMVKELDCLDVEESIYPLGYTATRKFPSIAEPSVCSVYKMEVLRDTGTKNRPVFRVTTDAGDQFDGPDPSVCWNKIYKRIRKTHSSSFGNSQTEGASERFFKSGADMFGFSDPHVLKLIQGTSSLKLTSGRTRNMPIGYRHVRVKWKDLDKCIVCPFSVHQTTITGQQHTSFPPFS